MLTLKQLLETSFPELNVSKKSADKSLSLTRHSLQDDRGIAYAQPLIQADDRLLTGREKLASLRTNKTLVEAFTAEMSSDRFSEGELVLTFCSTGGYSAEFLGAYIVQNKSTYSEWQQTYSGLLRPT